MRKLTRPETYWTMSHKAEEQRTLLYEAPYLLISST